MTTALHLLDAQIEALGRTVGCTGVAVSEELAAPPGEGGADCPSSDLDSLARPLENLRSPPCHLHNR